MGYVSDIAGMPVIDDSYRISPNLDLQYGRGRIKRDYNAIPHGSLPFAEKMPLPVIERSEWPGLIQRKAEAKARLCDLCDAAGLPVKNQQQTNYCWANAPVHCVEVRRISIGLPKKYLSPASVAAQVKNFQNVGGWGTEALEFITKQGVVDCDLWPANAIERKYVTNETKQNAAHHKVFEWYDLEPKNFDELATCLLLGIPVAVGYDWWSHEITAMDLVIIKNTGGIIEYGTINDNSWGMDWGDKGRVVLTESKATPDDACAPVTLYASEV